MAKLGQRLQASTLLESLISMVLIVVCFSTAVMIYVSVLDNDKQRIKLKALLILDREAIQIKKEKNFLDTEKIIDDCEIKKTVVRYEQTNNLYVLLLSVKDKDGKKIANRNELITIE